VFFDDKTLQDGDEFGDQIVRAISNSRVVVPIVSRGAVDMMPHGEIDWLLLEWQCAMLVRDAKPRAGIRVLPIRVLPVIMPEPAEVARADGLDDDGEQEDESKVEPAPASRKELWDCAGGEPVQHTMKRMIDLLRKECPESWGKARLPRAESWANSAQDTVRRLFDVLHSVPPSAGEQSFVRVEREARNILKFVKAGIGTSFFGEHGAEDIAAIERAVEDYSGVASDPEGIDASVAQQLNEKLTKVIKGQDRHDQKLDDIQQTLDDEFLKIQANFNKVHADTEGLAESLRIATALSECLLKGEHEMPTLVWVSPKKASGGLWGKLGSNWLTDVMVVYFICPYTMAVVGCGPNGEGYEIKKAKGWLTKHAVLISRSMFVVRLALAAGRMVGVPLPSLSLGDIVSGGDSVVASVEKQIGALVDLADKLPGCELPSAPNCAELCKEAGDAQGAWKASGLDNVQKALPAKLEGAAYASFKDWLEKAHPHWLQTVAMTKVRGEWVSNDNVEKWKAWFDGEGTRPTVAATAAPSPSGSGGAAAAAAPLPVSAKAAIGKKAASLPEAPVTNRSRAAFGTELSAEKRSTDSGKLVGARLRVFNTGKDMEGRDGTVVGVQKTFGGSTKHLIEFEGGSAAPEAVLLQKSKGAKKGLRFHVLE
jgi:hypothetical protein